MNSSKELKYKSRLNKWGFGGIFKMTTAQRVQAFEAARILFIFLLLWLAVFQMAHAEEAGGQSGSNLSPILDQPDHDKVLLAEGWKGNYFHSFYSETMNLVRIQFCEDRGRRCRLVAHDIPLENFERYQPLLVERLRDYRGDAAREINEHWMRLLMGDAESNEDIQTLDEIVLGIEAHGIKRWVQLSEECLRSESPVLNSTQVSVDIANILTEVFSTPVEELEE